MSFGILLLIPILVALIYHEWIAIEAFAISAFVGISIGYILNKVTPSYKEVHRNEGLIIVALAWAIAALLGAIPYIFFNLNFINALFESMSGITTTGATILKDFSLYPKAMFFWRSFTQWLGGLGIIVLFIAILPQFAVAGRQLFFAEAPGPTEDQLTPRIRKTAMYLWTLYIALTVIEIILLTIFGMPFFDSICNSLSTLAAGGFSPHPESIMGYKKPIFDWIIITFMFLAGANFALQFRVIKEYNLKFLFKNSEFVFYSIIFIGITLLLTFILMPNENYEFFNSLRMAAFQCISILTTTGFANADFNLWTQSAIILLLLLFFVGGCAGSSGGGIKVVRVLILFKHIFNEIVRFKHPKAVIPLKLDNQIVNNEILRQIIVFVILYLLILAASIVVISIIESDIVVAFTASAASIGNVGPGLGMVGPMGSYADLSTITKGVLIFDMWAGRLEIVAVLMLLSPFIWKGATRI
ncbi:MAG: TrkH family potassium uptake protein [Cyanobacteriota bacterium]